MSNPLILSKAEHVALIKLATRDKPLQCAFGIGWIRLEDSPINDWVVEPLNSMRGKEPNHDAAE